jgi:rubrerythrin
METKTAIFKTDEGGIKAMLSQIPILLAKVRKEDLDKEILRAAIIAELDAVNLYEQMANLTDNKHIKTILLDIVREEKTHGGEFQTLLLWEDQQQVKELGEWREEGEELIGE